MAANASSTSSMLRPVGSRPGDGLLAAREPPSCPQRRGRPANSSSAHRAGSSWPGFWSDRRRAGWCRPLGTSARVGSVVGAAWEGSPWGADGSGGQDGAASADQCRRRRRQPGHRAGRRASVPRSRATTSWAPSRPSSVTMMPSRTVLRVGLGQVRQRDVGVLHHGCCSGRPSTLPARPGRPPPRRCRRRRRSTGCSTQTSASPAAAGQHGSRRRRTSASREPVVARRPGVRRRHRLARAAGSVRVSVVADAAGGGGVGRRWVVAAVARPRRPRSARPPRSRRRRRRRRCTVMLSGPPPRSASSIIRSAHSLRVRDAQVVSASVSSLTTPDRPSEQSR